MNRRSFLQTAATASAALAVSPLAFCSPAPQPQNSGIGIQIYTLRDLLKENFSGTLKQVADIGYQHVELFGYRDGAYFGVPVKQLNTLLQDLGLQSYSCHIPTGATEPELKGTVTNDIERAANDARILGQQFLICPYLTEPERQSIDQYKKLAETFNRAGEICRQYGIQFGYHNHDFEFFPLDNQLPFDILLNETDPALVQFELDIYWINKAGFSHFDYFDKFPGRFPLWHVKDMDKSPEQAFAEVGQGTIPWPDTFKAAKTAGMQYFFVEQDVCKRPPLESITMSYQYLKSIL